MSHDILDDDKVVTVGGPAWHSLGLTFPEPISALDAHTAMGGSFTLYKKPVGVMFNNHSEDEDADNDLVYDQFGLPDDDEEDDGQTFMVEEHVEGEFVRVPGHWAIVRGPTNKDPRKIVFDYVSNSYHVVQPIELCERFDDKVRVGISSMGLIQDGRKMFLSWPLQTLEVVQGDEVKLFGNVLFGFDSIFSSRLTIGTFRVVCANTFNAAMHEADQEDKNKSRGRGTIYSGKHTNKNLIGELGEWMGFVQQNTEKQIDLISGLFKQFAQKKIDSELQVNRLLDMTWPFPAPVPEEYPEALREKAEKKNESEWDKTYRTRSGISDLFFGSAGIQIDPSYWGLFNAGTQYFNHEQKSKKDTSFSLAWGNRSSEMNKFAEVLRDEVNKEE